MKKKLGFSRENRLLTQENYQCVFDHATKINQKYFLALFKPNQTKQTRLGLIVSKRVAKNAVVRNRIKRIIRESFRARKELLQGLDIIVISRSFKSEPTTTKWREDMEQLWERLILYSQKHS